MIDKIESSYTANTKTELKDPAPKKYEVAVGKMDNRNERGKVYLKVAYIDKENDEKKRWRPIAYPIVVYDKDSEGIDVKKDFEKFKV